eukprot:SAG31_NODE_10564_length_1124_cov_0.978537_2_plen_323_part_00
MDDGEHEVKNRQAKIEGRRRSTKRCGAAVASSDISPRGGAVDAGSMKKAKRGTNRPRLIHTAGLTLTAVLVALVLGICLWKLRAPPDSGGGGRPQQIIGGCGAEQYRDKRSGKCKPCTVCTESGARMQDERGDFKSVAELVPCSETDDRVCVGTVTNIATVPGLGLPTEACKVWFDGCSNCLLAPGTMEIVNCSRLLVPSDMHWATYCTAESEPPGAFSSDPVGGPHCAEYWSGQRCTSANDADCLGIVLQHITQDNTNPCSPRYLDWDTFCAGEKPTVQTERCADGSTSGASCAPVGYPTAVCNWVETKCPKATTNRPETH